MFPKRISTIFLSIILTVSQNVSGFEINKYEVGALQFNNDTIIKTTWPIITLPKLDINLTAHNNVRKWATPRCLCGLGLPLPIPIPIPIRVNNGVATPPVIGVNNNVAATQLLSDGRTALYNNQGQIIGFLPAGSSVVNNNNG